ncbi:MAG: ribosome biogenesis GTPase Der [Alphaproteobacteria bacterium]|nr:ribosome biogenesis GTPase Der [Alphaproteobacteria bacterium]
MPLTVAIIGRPNVGKSTLFNRLAGKKLALIDNVPGLTRDRRVAPAQILDLSFDLIDTAGYEVGDSNILAVRMWAQSERAIKDADVSIFMVDGRAGLTAVDRQLAKLFRKYGKPVILLVNKCEGRKLPDGFTEAYELGFGEPVAISAAHNEGMDELREALERYAPRAPEVPETKGEAGEKTSVDDVPEEEENKPLHVAIVGRPNAGKSTLINHLTGEERMLTGPEPGLTRDAIHIRWEYGGRAVRLVDTAGMRKRARVQDKIEQMSVQESLRAIRLAHVVVLVVDATQALDKQDLLIAQHVTDEGRALVVAINKWDQVDNKKATLDNIRDKIERSLAQVSGLGFVTMSALKDQGLEALMQAVFRAYETWNIRVPTAQLNRWLEHVLEKHSPPIVKGTRIKLRYMTQVKARPPTFAIWVNKPVDLPGSYLRFLTNGLRESFGIEGVMIRWILKKGNNPFEKHKR